MFRRPHYCAFIFGAVLVLLAIVLVVNIESTTSHSLSHQVHRARVAQAVSYLESGCLTCHASVNTPQLMEHAYTSVLDHTQNDEQTPVNGYMPVSISGETTAQLQNQVNTQLIEMGQRILNLPRLRDQRAEAVVEEYLHVYEQTRETPSVSHWALWRLDGIESLLRILENQASPYQLVRQDTQPDQPDTAGLLTLAPMPNAAVVTHYVLVGEIIRAPSARPDAAQFAMPQDIVHATRRRETTIGTTWILFCKGGAVIEGRAVSFILRKLRDVLQHKRANRRLYVT
jgi:hypothetical protein